MRAAYNEGGETVQADEKVRQTASDEQDTPQRALFLLAQSSANCGVSDFTHRMVDEVSALGCGSAVAMPFDARGGLWRDYADALSDAGAVVVNFPVVAWKRLIWEPIRAMASARFKGRRVVLLLHEWASLNRMRRWTYLPTLLLAHDIVVMSAKVRSELAASWVFALKSRRVHIIPLPPTVPRPDATADSAPRRKLLEDKQSGKSIIASFGSIYPGKNPLKLVSILKTLREQGRDAQLVLVGGFVKGLDSTQEDFEQALARAGLSDHVYVTGYVDSPEELFGVLEAVDVFVYDFEEGMSSRRSSVLACVQAKRPVIVTEPLLADEFDDHPRLREMLDNGAISFVPRGSDANVFAEAVARELDREHKPVAIDVAAWWREAAEGLSRILKQPST